MEPSEPKKLNRYGRRKQQAYERSAYHKDQVQQKIKRQNWAHKKIVEAAKKSKE